MAWGLRYVVLFSEFCEMLALVFLKVSLVYTPFERGALMMVLRTLDGAEK